MFGRLQLTCQLLLRISENQIEAQPTNQPTNQQTNQPTNQPRSYICALGMWECYKDMLFRKSAFMWYGDVTGNASTEFKLCKFFLAEASVQSVASL